MSYSTRVYRQRNAHVFDNDASKEESSFFTKSNEQSASKGGKPAFFQPKLSIGQPNDAYEQEADAVASAVVNHRPGNTPVIQQKKISSIQRLATPLEDEKLSTNDERMKRDKEIQEKPELQMMCPECEKEKKEGAVQAKSEGGGTASPQLSSKIENSAGKGNSLPKKALSEMSNSFGVDFSHVNIHTDSEAVQMNKELGAQAFTHGSDIYFNGGKYDPETPGGKQLLAHELTHVVQQRQEVLPKIQRRLFVSGSNPAEPTEYLTLVGDSAGFRLQWAFTNPRVRIAGNTVAPPTSQNARRILGQIINHPTQHAEMFIGSHQPGVSVGAFPGAGSTIQEVDIDDIRNLNAALPGQGTAKAYHEMFENFSAHAAGGIGPFGPAHAGAVNEESNVLEDLGIAGRRLNAGSISIPLPDFLIRLMGLPTGPNISYELNRQVFTHYFLDMVRRRTITPAGADFEIIRAFRTPKTQLSQVTIDNFATGSNVIPAGGNPQLAATLAILNANPSSTLLVEGFTDDVGSAATNTRVSQNRAAAVQAFFIANGIGANRIAIIGRGETNFVVPNSSAANRALNRRVVLTVHN
jgi:outer membrane protein OmpA-like peptidoglycan-associated protein/uncharacterized protein YlaI